MFGAKLGWAGRRAGLIGGLSILVGVGVVRAASAAEAPVAVALRECPASSLSAEGFLSSLRAELAGEARACCTRLPAPAAGTSPAVAGGPTTLTVDPCGETANLVHVHVQDTRTGAALDRQVPLGDVSPDARPRALALAVAELVRAAATPVPPGAAVVAPPVAAPRVSAAAAAVEPPVEPSDGWMPVLGFAGRTHFTGDLTLLGFHAAIELARGPWQAALEGHVESANPSVPLGSVDTTFAGGALEIGRRLHSGTTIIELGLIGGLGAVHMQGVTSVPGAVTTAALHLEASAGARAAWDFWHIPHDRAHLRLILEGGTVIHGVQATVNGHDAVGLTGPYLLAALAASLGPF